MILHVLTPAGTVATIQCPACGGPRLPLATGPARCPVCRGEWVLVVNPCVGTDRARIDRVEIREAVASNSVPAQEGN